VRSKLLKEIHMLNDIDVTVQQVRDVSWGVQIPKIDDTDGQRVADSTLGSGKGKEKVVTSGPAPKAGSRSPPRDTRASASGKATAEQVCGSDGDGLGAAQAGDKKVAAPMPDPRVAAKKTVTVTGSGGSSGGGSRVTLAGTEKAPKAMSGLLTSGSVPPGHVRAPGML
jgi:hypothetical protein